MSTALCHLPVRETAVIESGRRRGTEGQTGNGGGFGVWLRLNLAEAPAFKGWAFTYQNCVVNWGGTWIERTDIPLNDSHSC